MSLPSTGDQDPRGRLDLVQLLAYGAVVLLGVLLVSIVLVSTVSFDGAGSSKIEQRERAARLARLPRFWEVRRGDTYAAIAERTGLAIDELEDLNPRTDPGSLVPGDRVRLRPDRPAERREARRERGPRVHAVRSGETLSSIAADAGVELSRLLELNPKLSPDRLRPGDRVRLRR